MTQHVDEIARAVRKDRFERNFPLSTHDPDVEPREGDLLDARAAMRAVVKQMRERTSSTSVIVFLTAYAKEAGIDE